MSRRLFLVQLLCCLLLTHQAAWADGVIVFSETFDNNSGTGGRDNQFSGTIASSNIVYDGAAWSNASSCYGAKQCMRIGTSSDNGTCTTPAITLSSGTTAVLTFNAAGWDDANKNKLTVTASGCTLSGDTNIELANAEWNAYTVIITGATAGITLTFTGKRGFIDDVVVENITSVDEPVLPDNCYFWANTTETPTKEITLTTADKTTIRYTTDGSEPTASNGSLVTQTSNIIVSGTTTVKAVAYIGDVVSNVVSRTYTVGSTVSGIDAFKALPDGTEARLYLADDANARVLHGHQDKEMYLRDNSGALCLDFGTTATFNPAPQHNQHVAGWIVGRKQTVDRLPKLVATENTSTNYLALAAPVTENATEPTLVDNISSVNDFLGDWVMVKNLREGQVTVNNRFDAEYFTEVYYQSLVDVSGIVSADNTMTPVYYNDIRPVIYVIDENEYFHSPQNNIQNATVRLKRTLGKDYWNTFVVPFDMSGLEGDIRVLDRVENNTLYFSEAFSMEAGKPYLVKPSNDIVDPVFTDIELSNTHAKSIDNGEYAFVGIYSPTDLATDRTMMFLKTDGKLYYPSTTGTTLKGMRAYFKVPAGQQGARVLIDGDHDVSTDIADVRRQMTGGRYEVYDLQGRSVSDASLKKGIYVVRGKKIVIH